MQSLPTAVARSGLQPVLCHPGLLNILLGTYVNDVTQPRAVNYRLEEERILPTALPIGFRQGPATAHDDLGNTILLFDTVDAIYRQKYGIVVT